MRKTSWKCNEQKDEKLQQNKKVNRKWNDTNIVREVCRTKRYFTGFPCSLICHNKMQFYLRNVVCYHSCTTHQVLHENYTTYLYVRLLWLSTEWNVIHIKVSRGLTLNHILLGVSFCVVFSFSFSISIFLTLFHIQSFSFFPIFLFPSLYLSLLHYYTPLYIRVHFLTSWNVDSIIVYNMEREQEREFDELLHDLFDVIVLACN